MNSELPKRIKPVPREVNEAALQLIRLAKQYNVPVDQAIMGAVDRKLVEENIRLAKLVEAQRRVIRRLELLHGVSNDDEL